MSCQWQELTEGQTTFPPPPRTTFKPTLKNKNYKPMKTVIPAGRVLVHNHVRTRQKRDRIEAKAELEARITLRYMALLKSILTGSGTKNS